MTTTTTSLIKQHLIKVHGNPSISQQGNYTMRVENQYLDNFNKFELNFNKLLKKVGINPDDYTEAINTMYLYFYEADYKDVKRIASHLSALNKLSKEKAAPAKQQLIKFFNDVLEIKSRPNFTPYKLRILFKLDLDVKFKFTRPNDLIRYF